MCQSAHLLQITESKGIKNFSSIRLIEPFDIAVPLLNDMFDWMEKVVINKTPKSPIYQALQYSIKRRKELMCYTNDGQLHIDNNPVENKIRPTVIGKKNYLFIGSHDAAKRSAMIFSFLISCKANNINPEKWLEDILKRIYTTKKSELSQLLPNHWKKQPSKQNLNNFQDVLEWGDTM